MRKSLLLLAAAVAVPTGNAEAQTWDAVNSFLHVCVTGSLRACGSVIVRTRWDSDAGVNYVEMLVRNEQGSTDNLDNTGGSFLTQIGLTAPTIEGVAGLWVATEGAVGQVGSPQDHWGILLDGGIGGEVTLKVGTVPDKQGAIKGCDAPNGNTPDFFITCDTQGHTGWVVFSFTTTNEWSAADAQIALKYQSIEYGGGGGSVQCRTGDEGGPHACAVAVIPEPETYVLLLTGLVGIFAMGWLRRKEEETT